MKLGTIFVISCECALLKRFWVKGQRSKVKGQGHDETECCNGGGMHCDDVASLEAYFTDCFFLFQRVVFCNIAAGKRQTDLFVACL